jgi:hypothetical protein
MVTEVGPAMRPDRFAVVDEVAEGSIGDHRRKMA